MAFYTEDHKEIESGRKKDDEGYMARIELDSMEKSINRLRKVIKKSNHQLPAWVQSKITRATDYIDSAAGYLSSDEELDETRFIGGSLTERILAEMGCDCDMKPHKSVNQIAKKHNTSVERIEKQLKKGIRVEMEHTADKYEAESIALQHLAERPDYYTRLLKVEAKKYMDADEDPCWKGYEMVGTKLKKGKKVPNCVPINEGVRIQSQSGQLMNIMLNWRNKVIIAQMFFPQVRIPKKFEVAAAVEKVYPGAKVISFKVSNIDPNRPLIQVNEEDDYLYEAGPSLSVKRGEKLSIERGGGLTKKGRARYNRETGSNLQAPVTGKVKRGSKAWKRRKSFCARSRGWTGPRGKAARKRWKC